MDKLYPAKSRKGSNVIIGFFRINILASFLLLVANTGWAQLSLTNASPSALIDFSNSMPSTVGTTPGTAFTGAGFSPNPATAGRLNSNAWASTGWSDGDLTFGGSQTGNDLGRGAVATPQTQGGIYAYTGDTHSAANPAMMLQPGGSDFTPGTLTLKMQNNGTTLINELDVSYNLYVRNDQNRSNKFNFSYSSDGVTFIPVSALDYASPTTSTGSAWVLVGPGSPSRVTQITGISILPSAVFYIRWTGDDVSGSGSRDEFGLDDINLTAVFVGACSEPTTSGSLSNIDNIFCTQMDFEYTRGNGTGGLMIVATAGAAGGVALSTAPANGVTYSANANFGTGSGIGNGFVVCNTGTSVPIGGTGSFTLTGLTPGFTYRFYYFEYNISVPCYYNNGGAWASVLNYDEQATPSPCLATNTTDYFRSTSSGNWADCRTWQSSPDNFTSIINSADRTPTSASAGITVTFTHNVDISSPASMDQLGINGTLTLSNDGVINLNDGAGDDMDIRSGGVLKIQTTKNYTATFPAISSQTINIANGGKITVGNGGATPGYSPLGYTAGFGIWNTGSVFEWNTTDPFITSGVTYFPNAASGTIPIFRVTTTPSLQPGSNSNTTWNGLMEVNSNLTLKLAGLKTFRNGIIGSGTLFQDEDCGQFIINGATAQLGGTGILHLSGAGCVINSGSLTSLISDKQIDSTLAVGELTVNGSLYCSNYKLTGSGIFTLASGGTLGMGSADGITPTGGATGNIQVTSARTYSTGANYIYNGSVNQITGTGLPATINTLTIANTGGSGSNTVSNTRAGTTIISSGSLGSLALTSGLFSIGATKDITIADNGGITASTGNFAAASSGSITFTGTGTVSGTVDFYPDVFQTPVGIKGVNFGTSSILHGLLQLNAGSFVNINAPTYLSTSLLKYNTGGVFNRNVEWSTAVGNGYPYHVQLSSNTTMDPTGTLLSFNNTTFKIAGNLTIDNGSAIYMDYSGHNMLTSLEIGGNLLLNGALSGSQVIGGDIKVAGNWTRSSTGGFFPNDRAVFFNGSTNSTIIANNGETFHYLYFTKNAVGTTVFLNDHIRVAKEFGINTGTLDLQAKDVTLLSSAAATASFASFGAGTPANAAINYSGAGRFVVERYIATGTGGGQHGKKWQFLAVPTKGDNLKASWMENNAPTINGTAGYGTIITSEKAGATGRGYDFVTTPGPSMKTYIAASGGWASVDNGSTNTSAVLMDNLNGYMVFVRGDRSVQTSGGTATSTNLRTRGKLYVPGADAPPSAGTPVNVTADKYEAIGNPYASTIDFTLINRTGGVDNAFYVWDPTAAGSYGYGNYKTISAANSWIPTGAGSVNYPATPVQKIQSGQAFFVHATGSPGTVYFSEGAKASGSSIVTRPVDIFSRRYMRVSMYLVSDTSAPTDGNVVVFDHAFSKQYDGDDALKLINPGENFGINVFGKTVAVEARAALSVLDTVFYSITNLSVEPYEFRFNPENMDIPGEKAYLVDQYKNTNTAISLNEITTVGFSIDGNPASFAVDRFMLVFSKKDNPVKFTGISAEQQAANILVSWNISDEANIIHYEIERSANGTDFKAINTIPATGGGSNSYNWLDTDPLGGDNFYRIRSVSTSNQTAYSKQVKVFIGKAAPGFVIYPNPVKAGLIGLQSYKISAGNYHLKLYTDNGQLVLSKSLYYPGGALLQQIQVDQQLSRGNYKLVITGAGSFRQVHKLILN